VVFNFFVKHFKIVYNNNIINQFRFMSSTTLKITPKDVFLHLFNIITFYLSIIGFITLYIQYISALFPDPLNYYFTSIANAVRTSTSILFISVPAYLLSSLFLSRNLIAYPEKKDLKLRKWLIYFTLFISAITIIIDLMIFVYNFLDGELTVQFFLKVLVVLLVASAVFGYYIWELKRKSLYSRIPKILAAVVALITLASIIIGFFIIGTPADQRERRFDEERIGDLQILQSQIVNYWSKKDSLPGSLSDLEDDIMGFTVPFDPKTRDQYEYQIIDPLTFELCAVFARKNQNDKGARKYPYAVEEIWNHKEGRQCWTRIIDPDLYEEKNIIN
jgi:hypothetical protein